MFSIETYRELQPHDQQEWLLTNGLGGFAASTVVGMNTRRYHGLLCAATLPPVGRIMTINRIGEILTLDGKADPMLELSVNTFRNAVHPRGDQYLTSFQLKTAARWAYDIDDVSIVKELQMVWLKNAAAVRYTINPKGRRFKLSLQLFASLRDFHSLRKAEGSQFRLQAKDRTVTLGEGQNEVTITADSGQWVQQPDWWYAQVYPWETERGQTDQEDLYTPGSFAIEGNSPTTITLWISSEPMAGGDWDAEIANRQRAEQAAGRDPENAIAGSPHPIATDKSLPIQKLFRAANDFIVARKRPDGKPGTSMIAGYPWFSDWGRDTMISLPGLLLIPGRVHQAREVLTVFAQYVSEGMIPNRFDDYSNAPEYNTVDGSLWFIHACFAFLQVSNDSDTFSKILRPACQQIIDGYQKGTRYHIKMDPADGLISQGDADTQLTWMDAKCGDICFTPRQGKPVEINALWYHALVLMGKKDLASKVADNFVKAFWIDAEHGLADGINEGRQDRRLRPNQIFAVSLPNSPLNREQQQSVVNIVQRELLTPFGLRTLARSDPGYRPIYTGDQFHRDGAYHNGTVWPWLIGPFLEGYLKVNGRSQAAIAQARTWLAPLIAHMDDTAAIGQVSEIYDGDEPHRPVGCPAQAWSVAEVLRLAVDLGM